MDGTNNYQALLVNNTNNIITVAENGSSPAKVTYKAGNLLTFSLDFETKSGSNFMLRIGGCLN